MSNYTMGPAEVVYNDDNLGGTISGNALGNTINGNGGTETIYGGDGNDTLNGGADNDTLYGGANNDTMDGGLNDDSLYGGTGGDTLTGGDGNDTFDDYQGANTQTGGNGNDIFRSLGYAGGSAINAGFDSVTGGTGIDTFFAHAYDVRYSLATLIVDTVTDFTAGVGGDIFDFTNTFNYLIGWDSTTNPFNSGFLRFRQVATTTFLDVDIDGSAAGVHTYVALLRMTNLTAANLTVDNFAETFSPNDIGLTLNGDDDNNTIQGTNSRDTINGLDSNDTLNGLYGDDTINGGSGDDTLNGSYGNDTMNGGTENDSLNGGYGNDLLAGADGNDILHGDQGNDTMNGGNGNDTFSDYIGTDAQNGGAGNDIFQNVSYGQGASFGVGTFSGGLGQDRYEVNSYAARYDLAALVTDIVTDFTTGAAGDILDFDNLFNRLIGWDSNTNPFTGGFVRIIQDPGTPANALLQVDIDGSAAAVYGFTTLVQLNNVVAANLRVGNFSNGYSINDIGLTITGTAGVNSLTGTNSRDIITAGGDNDTLTGLNGNDQLNGESGADTLNGGYGNDTASGGTEDDTLYGGYGNDTLNGDDGDDDLRGDQGNDTTSGGAGDDYFYDYYGTNVADGGDGNDIFYRLGYGQSANFGVDTVTGGLGVDDFQFNAYAARYDLAALARDIVTDFTPGVGGDLLRFDEVFNYFIGWDGTTNPFSQGFIRIIQNGAAPANALVQVDVDGAGASHVFKTIGQLNNVLATNLTVENFTNGYSLDDVGLTLTGTSDPETLTGTASKDTIDGASGADTLYGGKGGDTLTGGTGADSIYGGDGNDQLIGGSEGDTLNGENGNDVLNGGGGQDTLSGGNGNDTLLGGGSSDTLNGNAGADILVGGASGDSLTGGADNDLFRFVAVSDSIALAGKRDQINDFQLGVDDVDVAQIDAIAGGADDAFTYINAGAFTGVAGQLRAFFDGTRTVIQGDVDGGATADFEVYVTGNLVLLNTDYIL